MIFGSQLTPEQLAERRKGVGASDAAKILAGGEAWVELWKDKTGREIPKRIMSEWDAAIRHITESLQCDWYEHKTGIKIVERGKACIYKGWPVLRCTLDGTSYTAPGFDVFECKHVSSFTPDAMNWAIDKYTPQLQHQMIVCGTDTGIMSVMVGMKEPELVNFTLDPFFAEAYITRCREFWNYVETDTPPPGAEAMSAPIPPEAFKVISFEGNNAFADFATDWLASQKAAKSFEKAAKGIKEMIPADVKEATGHGLKVVRSKAGSLSIKEHKK